MCTIVSLKTMHPYFVSSTFINGEKWFSGYCSAFTWLTNQVGTGFLKQVYEFKELYTENGYAKTEINMAFIHREVWRSIKGNRYTKMYLEVIKNKYFSYNGCEDFLSIKLALDVSKLHKSVLTKVLVEANFYAALIAAIVGLGFGEVKIRIAVLNNSQDEVMENIAAWEEEVVQATQLFKANFYGEAAMCNFTSPDEILAYIKKGRLFGKVNLVKFNSLDAVKLDSLILNGDISKTDVVDAVCDENKRLFINNTLTTSEITDITDILPAIRVR